MGTGFVLSARDREGREVVLERQVWERHCIRDHPEVEPYLEAVPGVLADPNVIYESAEKATTHLYYRLGAATGRFKNCYLVVVVRYDLSPARIVTMYITTEPSGSIGRILYAKR